MNWNEIPRFPHISYSIHVSWRYLETQLESYLEDGLDMNPDFQRGHVWTEKQQVAYVKYMLRCPTSGKDIYFNHPGWLGDWKGDFVLVDGKQRLEAVRKFLRDEIKVFGQLRSEFGERIPTDICFTFNVAKLATRRDVLQWYIDFNAGGTPHSNKEINRVRILLQEES